MENTDTTTTLKIKDVEPKDAGQYKLNVKNSSGRDNKQLTLAVAG